MRNYSYKDLNPSDEPPLIWRIVFGILMLFVLYVFLVGILSL
jgi:hypothetical protein